MSKRLAEFNIQNAKYAIKSDGVYGTPVDFTYAQSFSKQANQSTLDLYGDGRIQASFVSDLGFTGNLGLMAIDDDYEIAMGRKLVISSGTAEINQTALVEHAIYIETNIAEEGAKPIIAKAWYFNVVSSKADETINQNTDSLNINAIEYPITVRGEKLKTADGLSDYTDSATGQNVYVYRVISLPSDSNYSTFGDSVPELTAKE